MRVPRSSMTALYLAILLATSALVWATLPLNGQSQLPMEPLHSSGQNVTAAYEGWFKNPDGSVSMLFGYFNRNLKEELDIPVGDNNRFDPGPADQGQPTHFLPQRQWGIFAVTVPPNFGVTDRLTWTLVINGQTSSVPAHLDARWEISPFFDVGIGNTPPIISFEQGGPSIQGPRGISTSLEATLQKPLTLTVWAGDDAKSFQGGKPPDSPPVTVTWSKFRGPGEVKFANSKPAVEKADGKWKVTPAVSGKATTTATFSEPGEYVLHVVTNDWSGDGGGGFQCCWTNGQVKVSVKP